MEQQKNTQQNAPIRAWSATKGKAWTGPKWARFRMFIQYYNGNAKYHSFDYTVKQRFGVKKKHKSELIGLTKLIELIHKKTKGKTYRYANIFCNLTSDLSTTTGNYDYLICSITSGEIKWKEKIFWRGGLDNNMIDVQKMRAVQIQSRDLINGEVARLEVQRVLELTIVKGKG